MVGDKRWCEGGWGRGGGLYFFKPFNILILVSPNRRLYSAPLLVNFSDQKLSTRGRATSNQTMDL